MDYRDPEWLADRLGLDKNTLYKFLQDGKIPAIQLGRKWLISEARVEQWLAEETERQTQARRHSVSSIERTVRQMTHLSQGSREVLRRAYGHARRLSHRHVGQEHLLMALLEEPSTRPVLAGIEPSAIETASPNEAGPVRRMGRKPLTRRAMRLAASEASRLGAKNVEPLHLLLGIVLTKEGAAHDALQEAGITSQRVLKSLDRPSVTKSKEKS